MPIENERKFILPRDFDSQVLAGWQRREIKQAYLNDGPRIRHIDNLCIFTYKKWVPQAKELVEIELAISQDDFDLLWSQRVQTLQKVRFQRQIEEEEWVVDFLRDEEGHVFVVMAEVEMPRYQVSPKHIPEEIAAAILYAVDAGDNRFTNKKLSDPLYAARMYEDVVTSV